jgi:hypothetical protein
MFARSAQQSFHGRHCLDLFPNQDFDQLLEELISNDA